MQVTQTQRNTLTDKADGGRSESIISTHLLRLCTPLPIKYCESKGIKDLGYTKVKGKTRYNEAKNEEIKDRVSM